MEGLRDFCCDVAVNLSADTRLFCSDADAALWEDYCDSFRDVQTIGVVFGAFSCWHSSTTKRVDNGSYAKMLSCTIMRQY